MLRCLYRSHSSESYPFKSSARWFLQARRRYPLTCTKATTETLESAKTQGDDEDDEDVDIQIEGLTDDYCDDFVCTSSPAVEQTLRSLAKDLVRRKWTPVLFARDVKYRVRISSPRQSFIRHIIDAAVPGGGRCMLVWRLHTIVKSMTPFLRLQDTYRRFSSAERHRRLLHIAENVKDAKVVRQPPCYSPEATPGCTASVKSLAFYSDAASPLALHQSLTAGQIKFSNLSHYETPHHCWELHKSASVPQLTTAI